jgi:hypothetical protein
MYVEQRNDLRGERERGEEYWNNEISERARYLGRDLEGSIINQLDEITIKRGIVSFIFSPACY